MTTSAQKRSFGVHDLAEFRARMDELKATLEAPAAAGDFVAHTDGACLGNPQGPGGWGAAIGPPADEDRWLLFGHLSSTTNNRAEALAVLATLDWIPPDSRLTVLSDSELTVRVLSGRYKVKANLDIWDVIRATILEKRLTLQPEWLRGHAGDPLNELADRLANLGALNRAIEDLAVPDVAQSARAEEPPELAGLEPRGDWEREFLSSVADQLRRGRKLSEKQQAVVDRIRSRAAR
jgi:ribonuclease HI